MTKQEKYEYLQMMRNKQKNEEMLNRKTECNISDPTPYLAIKNIINQA